MGKKVITLLLVFIIFISFVSAITYRANNKIDIRHSVRVNDAPTSSASCNITIYDPNSIVLVEYSPMSYSSSSQTYNYTLPSSNTSEFGEYNYDVTCLDGVFNKTDSFSFDISPNGKEYTISESITYIFVLLLTISLFILCFYSAMKIKSDNHRNDIGEIIQVNWKKHLKLLLIVMCYIILLWINYITWNITFAYISLPISRFFWFVHRTLFSLLIPIGITYVIFALILFIHDLKLTKLVEKGIRVE